MATGSARLSVTRSFSRRSIASASVAPTASATAEQPDWTSIVPISIQASPTLWLGKSHDNGKGSPAVRAPSCDPRVELSSASAVEVPEWPVAMCRPRNTENQLLASDTRSIGHEASTNKNWRLPVPLPHRDEVPMFTVFGLPKLPQTIMKSGLVAAGGFWQLPWPANR